MFPRPSSATDATKRQSRHTGGLSIVFDVAEKKLCVCVICGWKSAYCGVCKVVLVILLHQPSTFDGELLPSPIFYLSQRVKTAGQAE